MDVRMKPYYCTACDRNVDIKYKISKPPSWWKVPSELEYHRYVCSKCGSPLIVHTAS